MTAGPVLDGGRAFYGRPQLTDAENRVLSRIAEGQPLVAVCEHGGKAFYIGNAKVRTATAQRLITRRYVRPRDAGLLSDPELAQTFEVTPREAEEEPSS
jgi:hypothetical protein